MVDFRIRLTTEVEDGKSKAQLDDIISQLEKNKIKLKFDTSSFKTEMNQLQQVMNNAFKLNPKQLNNLNSIKTTLKEINKMSKDVQKTLLGGNASSNTAGINNTANTVKNLTKEYDRCQAKIKSLQNQMSKTTNAQSYEVLEKQLDKVQKKAESTLQELNKMGKSPDLTQNLAKSFQTLQQKIESTQTKLEGFSKNKNLTSVQVKEIEKLKNTLNSLGNAKLDNIINSKESYSDMAKLETVISQVQSKLKTLTWNQQFTSQVDKAKSSVDGMIDKLNQIKGNNTYLDTSSIDNLINKIKQLNDIKIDPNSETASQQLDYLKSSINSVSNEFKQLSTSSASFDKIQSQIDQLRQKCVELGTSTSQLDSFEQELREIGNLDLSRQAKELERVGTSVKTFKSSLSGVKTETKATNGFFKELNSSIAAFSIGNILADGLQTGVYAIKDTIVELDSAFRDLMKVAPESFRGTKEELNSVRDHAASVGQEVAKSSVDIINSTSNALQSGFKSVNDALQYAKESAKFSNVSDMTQEDTDKALRSILSSYGGVENALKGTRTQIQGATQDYSMMNRVLDASNFLGNNYATSTQSIAQGMQNTGSALKAMNVSLEDGMAYFVAIDEIMQNAGMSSNGLKAIAMNMTGITVSAKDGSLSMNKSAKALKQFAKIDVQKPNGELKDMGLVLDELGGKWDTLNKTQQQALMIAIGGKHRAPQFAALMDNWETVKKIQKEISSGMAIGSADKENEKYINSLEGKLTRLSDSLKKLVTTTVSSDMFGGMVDGLRSIIDVVNNVISAFDKLGISTPVVLGTIGGLFTTIKSLGNDKEIPNLFGGMLTYIDGLDSKSKKAKGSFNGFSQEIKKATDITSKTSVSIEKVGKGTEKLSKGFTSTKLGAIAANAGVTLLNAGVMALAGVGISLAIKGIDNFVNRSEKLAEASRNRQAEIQGEIDSTKQQVSGLSQISKEYDKLANKTNKSKEELARFNELKSEIASISPDLVLGYDADNSPILAINGSLENTIKLKKEILALDQQILAEEKKQEVEANRDKSERTWEQQGKLSSQYKGSPIPGKENYDKTEAVVYNGSVKAYKKSLEDKKTEYNKYINEMSKIRSEYNEIELKAQQVAITELNKSLEGSKLNDKTLQNINSLAGAFNWGKLSAGETQQVQQGFKNLNNEFGKFNVGNIQKQISNLAMDYEAGSISQDQYAKGIENLATELNKAGLDIEKGTLIKALQQFRPELQEVQYEIANVLSNHKLKLSDLGTNGIADMLANQLTTIKGLTSKFLSDIEADGTINIKTIPKIGDELYETLPTQIQGAIDTIMADKKISEQEAEILMKLMTTWENEGELDEAHLKELEELDGKQITHEIRAKLNAEVSDDYKKYVINKTEEGKSLESTITAKFKTEGQNEYANAYKQAGVDPNSKEGKKIKNEIDAEFKQKGFEASTNVADVMNKLGLTSEKQQSKFLSSIEAQIETGNLNLDTLQNAQSILDWLEGHPDIAKKVGLTVDENGNIKEVAKFIDEMQKKPDVEKKVKMHSEGFEVAQQKVNALNGSSIHDFVFSTTDNGTTDKAQQKVNKLSWTQIKDKIVEIVQNGGTGVSNTLTKINGLSGNKNKKITVNESGGKSVLATIKDINSNAKSKTVTITTIFKEVKKTVSSFFSGGKKKKSIDAPATYTNPIQQTRDIQPLSESSTSGTILDDSTTSSTPQITPRYSNNFGGILTTPSLSTKLPSSYGTMLNMLKHGINIFQELENRIDKVNNQIKLLDLQMENSVGTDRIKNLQTQNELYAQQCQLQKDLFDVLENQRRAMQGKVPSFGFSIDGHGNLTNYEETLNRLESAYENAKKKESEYKGEDEATKNRLSKATEEANKQLSEAKEFSSEYLDLFYNKIPGAEQEWQKLQNAIKENNDEIERLDIENSLYKFKNAIKELNNEIDKCADKIDLIDIKLEGASGAERINLMKDKIQALNDQLKIQQDVMDKINSELNVYRQYLANYGVQFDSSGEITNYDEVLNNYQNSEDLKKATELLDEYIDKIRDELPDAQKEYHKLENAIKDVYQEQLKTTKEVEDKLTEIYKKQVEDRIKEIEKQRDAELKALNEKKKAYQAYRDEVNYKDDYNDQMEKINKLKKQLEIAQRDDSLGGKKKVEELLQQLEEENERLQEIVQDKIDKDVNDTFDKENDRIEDKADKEIEDLENKWTDSKIAELVAQALGSGIFTSIDGEVSSLKDTMLEFTEESGEALGVLGSQIQKELCDKLVVAQDVMDNLPNILDKLNLKDYSARSINIQSGSGARTISIGDTNINISGNANDDVVNKIKEVVKAENEKLIKELYDRS